MSSFFEDICQLSGRGHDYFEERHDKKILEELCDRSASLKVWEDAVRKFISTEKIYYFVRFRD